MENILHPPIGKDVLYHLHLFLKKLEKLFEPNFRILTQEEHLRKLWELLCLLKTSETVSIRFCFWTETVSQMMYYWRFIKNPYLSTHEGSCDPLQGQEEMLCFYWNIIVLMLCWFLLYNSIDQLSVKIHSLRLDASSTPPSHPCRPSRSPELSSLGSTAAPASCLSHALPGMAGSAAF